MSCLEKLTTKKCPTCGKKFNEKNPNMAVLEFIPESNYDKLKGESLKALIEINEAKQDLKNNRLETVKKHQTKLFLVKKVVSTETSKLVDVLKKNEETLTSQCDMMLNDLNASLDSSNYEESISFPFAKSKEAIEKNTISEEEIKNLNIKLSEIKEQLSQLTGQVKKYESNYKFTANKVSNEHLLIGKITREMVNFILLYLV